MSFPRYPKYKDSGMEWLGQVPEHWDVKRARALGVFSSSGIDKKSVEGEQAVQMFNYLDVYKSTDKILRYSPELMWTTAPSEKVAGHAVKTGDILLTPSSETEDDIGHAARVTDVPPNVVYSYHLIRFRTGEQSDSAYLSYCFNAHSIRSYFESVCTGTTRMVLVREDFKNAPFACPPLDEQTRIAAFLDRETGKIDALVAEQQRLMELLKEKRQAVISHAVTKGLNPKATMKSSGIDWLGDVPEGWKVAPLKTVISKIIDNRGRTPPFGLEGIPMLEVKQISEGQRHPSDSFEKYVNESVLKGYERDKVKAGDILITTVGATCGKCVLVDEAPNYFIAQNVVGFRINDTVANSYLWYMMSSEFFYHSLVLINKSNTIDNLKVSVFVNNLCTIPSKKEQVEIATYLDHETAKLDTLTAAAHRAIDLLQERRAALISAAVTGQIDVRHLPVKEAA